MLTLVSGQYGRSKALHLVVANVVRDITDADAPACRRWGVNAPPLARALCECGKSEADYAAADRGSRSWSSGCLGLYG